MIKKRLLLTTAIILLLSLSGATARTRITRQEYVERYKKIAISHMERYGIPASITLAQGILESDCGNSQLAANSNNHFGIKCKSYWTGRTVYYDDDEKGECFRAYNSVEKSYEDHAIFLDSSPRYDSLFAYSSSDYKSWAHGLKAAGYATAPHYANLLIKIIEDDQLYLLDQDNGERLYAARSKAGDVVVIKEEEKEVDPDNFSVTINAHKGYNIERTNGLYFTRAKSGDTIESIANAFEISKSNLRRFNDMDKKSSLSSGDIIFIERKKAKWEGDDKRTHQVVAGETLHEISQRYGIRLRRLCRLNDIKNRDKDKLKIGQIIIIR